NKSPAAEMFPGPGAARQTALMTYAKAASSATKIAKKLELLPGPGKRSAAGVLRHAGRSRIGEDRCHGLRTLRAAIDPRLHQRTELVLRAGRRCAAVAGLPAPCHQIVMGEVLLQ